jgi:hypothetical protein
MQLGHSDAVKQIMSIYCFSTVLAVTSCSNYLQKCVWLGPREGKLRVVLKLNCSASLYLIGITDHHIFCYCQNYNVVKLLCTEMQGKVSHMLKLLQCCIVCNHV